MLKKVAVAQIALALAVGWQLTHPELSASAEASAVAAIPAQPKDVVIQNFSFGQKMMTVPAGTTIRWINRDEEPHTVTSSDGAFASPGLDNGDTYSHRFETPGTYTYFCSLHPYMTGQVIVK